MSTTVNKESDSPARRSIERILAAVVLGLLLIGCFVVLRPFLSALLWAIVLCFATWPVYGRLLKLLRGRRTLAALAMTALVALVLLVPFLVIGISLADEIKGAAEATTHVLQVGLPGPPRWVERIPLAGAKVSAYWQSLTGDAPKLRAELARHIEPVRTWLMVGAVHLVGGLTELGISLLIGFFLFRDGLAAANRLTRALQRLAGSQAAQLLELAGNTVRGVVYGILGTALAQAIVAGIGFVIAGVPRAGLLTLLTFFLSVVPMGPPLVWVPATIWLFYHGSLGWGIFMACWGVMVSSIDNVIKPMLISQGSQIPFVLILFGVLGGAIAFGFIGVFIGPTLLAVGFRLLEQWIGNDGPSILGRPPRRLDKAQ
jgi:predicted PurR-regulated permease PerM